MEGKKTPLYKIHEELGGKIVNYAGWLLPVQYEGLAVEHHAVRNDAGLFDVSHMGSIYVEGKEAEKFLDYLLTNDISKQEDHQILYTLMCKEDGGVVDDFLVYKYNDEKYLLVVNAANIEKDHEWIKKIGKDFDVEIRNVSDDTAILALQGPKAEKVLQKITDFDLSSIGKFKFEEEIMLAGKPALVSRNGYTGEDGFEIYMSNDDIEKVYREIYEAGKEFDLKPAGLGSRDTLRFEAMLPLYGNEISEDINPLEGGLKFFVKLKKESDFIGKEELKKQDQEGLKRKMVGFELEGRGIPREGYDIEVDGKKIGFVTTGYLAPTVGKAIGNALVDSEFSKKGTKIDVIIRNKPVKAFVRDRNFLER